MVIRDLIKFFGENLSSKNSKYKAGETWYYWNRVYDFELEYQILRITDDKITWRIVEILNMQNHPDIKIYTSRNKILTVDLSVWEFFSKIDGILSKRSHYK